MAPSRWESLDFAARFQRANLPCMQLRPGEQAILDYAQEIQSAGLIMNGSKHDRTEPWQARDLAEAINRIFATF